MSTTGDVFYASKGWSTSDGGKTFKRNADPIDADCLVAAADGKSCVTCNIFSGKL
jgi:hypothetical protein